MTWNYKNQNVVRIVVDKVLFKSESIEWGTPQYLFDELNEEFDFVLDCCANEKNHKCEKWFSKEENGLSVDWFIYKRVFMNPPYGRQLKHWMRKAYEEYLKGTTVVCLVPSRTDTIWWHDYCMKATEIRFIKGRLTFEGAKNSAPFPSAIIVFQVRDYPNFFGEVSKFIKNDEVRCISYE